MIGGLVFSGLSVALLLDALRRFTATSAIALAGNLSPFAVALIVLLPFLLSVVVIAGLSRAPTRPAVFVTAAVFAASTLAAPFAEDTGAVIVLAGTGCLAGATLLSLLAASGPRDVTPHLLQAVALGLILDVARRTSLGTLDLAELPGAGGPMVVAILGAAYLGAAAVAFRRPWAVAASPVGGVLTLGFLPLVLVVAELAGTNGWQTAAMAGLGRVDAHGLRATGIGTLAVTVGLALGSFAPGNALRVLAASSLVGGAAVAAARLPTVSLAGGTLLAAGLVMWLRLRGVDGRAALSPTRVAAAMSAGWIGFVAVTLGYYVPYAFVPALWVPIAVVAAAALTVRERPPKSAWPLRLGAVAAMALSLIIVASAPEPRPVAASGTLRLMTYNIHFGFDYRQTPSLDALARTIEAESPDVVVLQEVMRGGSLAVQHDALGWLAGRLGMRYVFAPTVGDFFGNAVLTRMSIDDDELMSFVRPAPLRHSPRGALLVRIAGVAIAVTHLDEYVDADGDAVREDEVRALLAQWGEMAPPLVIAGDLNAVPDSRAIAILTGAGFRDLAAGAGDTIPAVAPTMRIDYVLAKGIAAASARVLTSSASDHRAVVVDLVLPPR